MIQSQYYLEPNSARNIQKKSRIIGAGHMSEKVYIGANELTIGSPRVKIAGRSISKNGKRPGKGKEDGLSPFPKKRRSNHKNPTSKARMRAMKGAKPG